MNLLQRFLPPTTWQSMPLYVLGNLSISSLYPSPLLLSLSHPPFFNLFLSFFVFPLLLHFFPFSLPSSLPPPPSLSLSLSLSACPPTVSQNLEQAVMQPAWKLRHNKMETGTASVVQRSAFCTSTLVCIDNIFLECYVGLYQWCWWNRCVPYHGTHWGTRFGTYPSYPLSWK